MFVRYIGTGATADLVAAPLRLGVERPLRDLSCRQRCVTPAVEKEDD